ncbi:MAG: inner membrane protein YbjJ [Actinomycetota bacterium]
MARPRPSPVGVIGTVFFVNGASFANWLPRIDEVRDAIGTGNGGLGAALLGGGLGGMLGSLAAARLLRPGRILRVLRWSAAGLALAFPLLAVVPSVTALFLLLTVLGFTDVLCDTSMNAEAAAIQSRTDGSIMHRIHGMWSVGFVAGTLVGWTASATDLALSVHLVLVSALLLVVSSRAVSALDEGTMPAAAPEPSGRGGSWGAAQVSIVMLALGAAALESTPNDWSAVALRDWLDAGRLKGAGPVVFAAAMLLGRFRGDRLVDRLGPARLLATALTSIVAGTAVIVLSARTVPALAGFALWGLGVSVMFPQVYLMAANADPSRPGAGLAAMTLAQRTGFMVTAASMGAVSARAGYATAFVAVVAGASILWLGGLSVQRGHTHEEALS